MAVFFGTIGVGLLMWRDARRKEKAEELEREYEIAVLGEKAQAALNRIESLKTATAKANACGKAISLLKQAEQYPECRQVINGYDALIDRLARAKKVLPVISHIERAYKHKYKGKEKLELNALQDALFDIKVHDVTNQDFDLAGVYPEGTGEIVSIENIEDRCRKLGWEPK